MRKLVYQRPTYTNLFIEFDAISKLPEDEQQEEEDEGTEEKEIENVVLPSQAPLSPSTQSVCSTSSSTSSSYSGIEKNSHLVCAIYGKKVWPWSAVISSAPNAKDDRKKECARLRGKRKENEEKILKCTFLNCGQEVERAIFMDLDM